jgi:hypothetical protein
MPFTQPWLEVNFGTAYAGLVGTVGYRLYQADDSDSVARSTASIVEIGTNTGCYGVVPPSIPDNAVGIEWDTGGGSPVSATEDLEPYRRLVEMPADVDTELTSTHGAGSWVGIVPSIPAIATAVWNELTAAHEGDYSRFGGILKLIEQILRNKLQLADGSSGNWVLRNDGDSADLLTWDVTDKDGNPVILPANAPARRSRGA